MNVRQLTIALSFIAAAGSAAAVEAEQWNPPPSTASRAEVQAELRQAAASGELAALQGEAYGSFDYRHVPATTLTRAQVKQDLARARANGELPVVNEAYSGFIEPQAQSTRAYAGRKTQKDAKTGG
ncbi:DUF4148 domain-containing protein [Piscinibacter sp. XHJ-5]|uniref:DUF4148 domain-containing protein n=1 Tax=Piscinibacter sp. XHJ-5 TaxID=3037797 RepID=UPI0024532CC5|nr:DUF4148 domain-containing protein [Piscinibacter sp. XHJ-5]